MSGRMQRGVMMDVIEDDGVDSDVDVGVDSDVGRW